MGAGRIAIAHPDLLHSEGHLGYFLVGGRHGGWWGVLGSSNVVPGILPALYSGDQGLNQGTCLNSCAITLAFVPLSKGF